jgi:hypothetical protein
MMQGGTDPSVALLSSLLNDDSTTCRKLIALQPLPCIGSDGSSGATGNLQSSYYSLHTRSKLSLYGLPLKNYSGLFQSKLLL